MRHTIIEFEKLRSVVEAFGKGNFQLLGILGDPGLGKSRWVKAVLGEEAHLIEGQTTPFELRRSSCTGNCTSTATTSS